mmetsp:Transcript_15138/g.41851  ORF Transcript_15138/g.41851 Transcript_15138/m.41851 type:complete len:249 (+) Transcript_15138:278-1024(+)
MPNFPCQSEDAVVWWGVMGVFGFGPFDCFFGREIFHAFDFFATRCLFDILGGHALFIFIFGQSSEQTTKTLQESQHQNRNTGIVMGGRPVSCKTHCNREGNHCEQDGRSIECNVNLEPSILGESTLDKHLAYEGGSNGKGDQDTPSKRSKHSVCDPSTSIVAGFAAWAKLIGVARCIVVIIVSGTASRALWCRNTGEVGKGIGIGRLQITNKLITSIRTRQRFCDDTLGANSQVCWLGVRNTLVVDGC